MPPKGEATTFSFEIVACLIAAMEKNGQILGNKHFAMMARLDGSRSESGFQHLFRAVKRRGKEIAESLDDADATPKKAKKPAAPASSSKKRPSNATTESEDDGEEDLEDTKTPSKKQKVKTEPSPDAFLDDDIEKPFL